MGAIGGSGRSVVAGLLADAFAASGETVLLDLAPRLTSPWPRWTPGTTGGLAALPPDQPASRSQARAAAATAASSGGLAAWQVLTDHLPWHAPPLVLPDEPEAWEQLAAIGGWQAVVIDTPHPFTHDVMTAHHTGIAGLSARWCSLPCAVPVLCAAATGDGIAELQTAVLAAEAAGLPLARIVVALVAIGDGRLPAPVKAGATMLQPKVGAIIHVPYDERIRSHGLSNAARLKPRTLAAGRELAEAALSSAHASWGQTLPHAAVPAAYTEGTTYRGLAHVADHPR
ncbi:hypothetical protein [Streptomyces griseocarneus]|uniref:hypothetical protein n=1 Tax=Streptomyces griseocarneus TaxID=51201 RepID=UPI00167D902E|nr:hypothetical protein [Streptomyces griseocarneus]MBZ6475885.1 hypothetical protein [Streptomyces griseocarneus]